MTVKSLQCPFAGSKSRTISFHKSTVNRQPISITLCTVKPFIEAPLILDTKD